jgi:hypothetical protein
MPRGIKSRPAEETVNLDRSAAPAGRQESHRAKFAVLGPVKTGLMCKRIHERLNRRRCCLLLSAWI